MISPRAFSWHGMAIHIVLAGWSNGRCVKQSILQLANGSSLRDEAFVIYLLVQYLLWILWHDFCSLSLFSAVRSIDPSPALRFILFWKKTTPAWQNPGNALLKELWSHCATNLETSAYCPCLHSFQYQDSQWITQLASSSTVPCLNYCPFHWLLLSTRTCNFNILAQTLQVQV
jgi:hypothetical protein